MAPSTPRLSVVVVNFESGSLLLDCVRSLLADADPTIGGAGTPEVVVVDNGSTDGSVAELRAAMPDVTVVDPGGNLGYAAAANRGIAATTSPVVAVSNADLVVAPGTAAAMLARFDAEADLAAVGPALFNPDGSQYPSARAHASTVDAVGHAVLGRLFPRNRFTRRYRQLDARWDRPRDVDWVSGALMYLRRSALDSVGGWDERYFMYMEDFDLCWRLRRLGWRVAYEPSGRVTHVQGASTARRPYRMIVEHHRSAYRFLARRWRGARRLLLLPAACFLTLRAAVDMAVRALGTRPRRRRSAGNLRFAMPQSRTRSQRAAMRSKYRKPKRRRSGSMGWNVAIASIIIIGIVSVFLVRGGGDSAGSGPPRAPDSAANVAGDHWHTAFQVNVCGEWLSAQPQFEKPADNPGQQANVGIHTHGDNLIHTHPFVVSEEGSNAKLSKFADYGGWSVSSDSINAWTGPQSKVKQTEWSNGDTCTFGKYKGKQGELTWAVDGKPRTGNPGDYHMKDGETLAIYFLPKGADQPFPPDACTAFNQINDNSTANLSKNSPCNAIDATTTTSPGATTTAPAATSTSSP